MNKNISITDIETALQTQDSVVIRDFGTFRKSHRAERMGRNPQNGEVITIPASVTVTFKPSPALRASVSTGS